MFRLIALFCDIGRFFFLDPTDIKRSLCQTMQAMRSINYFRDTLNTALNYFGRKQKKIKKCQLNEINDDDDLIEIIVEDEDEIPIIEPNNCLHNSYKLFYKILPLTIIRDVNIRQNRIRDFYKKTFNMKYPQSLIKLDQIFENLNENEIEEAFQHDIEHNFETMDANDDDDEQNILLDTIISNNYHENLNTDFNELNIENDVDQKQSAVLVKTLRRVSRFYSVPIKKKQTFLSIIKC
jgi:hypothetical protein